MEENIQTIKEKLAAFKPWQVNVSENTQLLPYELLDQLHAYLDSWQKYFPSEDTFVAKNWLVPSALVSIDFTMNWNKCEIYDIDETPRNLGIAYILNHDFRNKFESLRAHWPKAVAIHGQGLKIFDDYVWIENIDNTKVDKSPLVFPRNAKFNNCQPTFSDRSLSPIKHRGDKSWGEKMGLWKVQKRGDDNNLPWDDGFVIKPVKGESLKDLQIFVPRNGAYRKAKGVAKEDLIRRMIDKEDVYLQKFIAPMSEKDNQYSVLKMYFGFNPSTRRYVNLGGLKIKRPNLRVHGNDDATFSSLLIR